MVLDAERMREEWLRRRFTEERPGSPEINVEQQIRQVAGTPRGVAVLMSTELREQGPTLLFNERNADLKDHAGQISFPGGRTEAERRFAGRHRPARNGRGNRPGAPPCRGDRLASGVFHWHCCVTPVAGLIRPPFDVVPDPREVAEIFEVPLAFLMDGMNHQRRTIELPNDLGRRTFYTMPYERFFIWGATAGGAAQPVPFPAQLRAAQGAARRRS